MIYLNLEDYTLVTSLSGNANPYGAVQTIHRISSQEPKSEFQKSSLFAYLSLWAYVEYFAYMGEKNYDAQTKNTIAGFLKQLKKADCLFYLYSPVTVFCSRNDMSFSLHAQAPVLSQMGWGFLREKFPEDFLYLALEDQKLVLSPFAEAQFNFAKGPEELLAHIDHLVDDLPALRGVSDPAAMGLGKIFKDRFLSAPGLGVVLFPEGQISDTGMKLWDGLTELPFDTSAMVRDFIRALVEHHAVNDFLSKIQGAEEKAYLELALILPPAEFKKLLVGNDDLKKEVSAEIFHVLSSQSKYPMKDRLSLLNNMCDFLTQDHLRILARQYQNKDWFFFSTVKQKAAIKEGYVPAVYEKFEKDNEQALKDTWPETLKLLEKMIADLEFAQNQPASSMESAFKSFSTKLPTAASYLKSIARTEFAQDLVHDLDLSSQIRKDLKSIVNKGGLGITDQTHSQQVDQLMYTFMQEYPGVQRLSSELLPLDLQTRLTALFSQPKAEHVEESDSKQSSVLTL